jgi:hypothetical protein
MQVKCVFGPVSALASYSFRRNSDRAGGCTAIVTASEYIGGHTACIVLPSTKQHGIAKSQRIACLLLQAEVNSYSY